MAWMPRVEIKHHREHRNIQADNTQMTPHYQYRARIQLPPNIYKKDEEGNYILDENDEPIISDEIEVYPFSMVVDKEDTGNTVDVVVLSPMDLLEIVRRLNALEYDLRWSILGQGDELELLDVETVTIAQIIEKLNDLEKSVYTGTIDNAYPEPNHNDAYDEIMQRIANLEYAITWDVVVEPEPPELTFIEKMLLMVREKWRFSRKYFATDNDVDFITG